MKQLSSNIFRSQYLLGNLENHLIINWYYAFSNNCSLWSCFTVFYIFALIYFIKKWTFRTNQCLCVSKGNFTCQRKTYHCRFGHIICAYFKWVYLHPRFTNNEFAYPMWTLFYMLLKLWYIVWVYCCKRPKLSKLNFRVFIIFGICLNICQLLMD